MTDRKTATMDMLTAGLIWLLDVMPGEAEGHFTGRRKPGGVGRVYGGQVIGQALMAANKTVPEDRPVHSLHAYFMRPGSEDFEIDYHVEADMDGGAFSNRRVVAMQQGKPILNMIASFHRREPGFGHHRPMPDVPPPETLPTMRDYYERHPEQMAAGPMRMIMQPSPIEFRPVGLPVLAVRDEPGEPAAECWVRVGGGKPLGVAQSVQRATLALVSDALLLATAYIPHRLQLTGANVQSASIDHSVWFHDDVECGDWLLYVLDSPWAGGARGIGRGHFYTREGRLVASVAQEGLMRVRSGKAD